MVILYVTSSERFNENTELAILDHLDFLFKIQGFVRTINLIYFSEKI